MSVVHISESTCRDATRLSHEPSFDLEACNALHRDTRVEMTDSPEDSPETSASAESKKNSAVP